MDLLNSLFQFFTDKTKGLSHKAMLVILSVALLVLLDNTFSFSYYFNTKSKIEQVSGINEILSDTTLSNQERSELEKFRHNIIFRSTWKDQAWKFASQIEFNSFANDTTAIKEKASTQERSYFWHFVSSGWVFIVFMIVMPFVAFTNKTTKLSSAIGMLIILEPMFYLMAWIFAKILSFIPLLFHDPFYNYVFNFFLSFSIVLILSFTSNKKKEKSD